MFPATKFDCNKKEVVIDCKLNPAEVSQKQHRWLYARNNKYQGIDIRNIGKWMLFVNTDKVNVVWNKVKEGIKEGHLWDSKVSTVPTPGSKYRNHVIIIYTRDHTDVKDVKRVLRYLEQSNLKPPNAVIYYKTDQQTYANIYSGGNKRPWIYSSETINMIKVPDSVKKRKAEEDNDLKISSKKIKPSLEELESSIKKIISSLKEIVKKAETSKMAKPLPKTKSPKKLKSSLKDVEFSSKKLASSTKKIRRSSPKNKLKLSPNKKKSDPKNPASSVKN